MTELLRFIQAQTRNNIYHQAYAELAQGQKTSHWIWYIFPQLQGLGSSANALEYGIKDLNEACAYLQNKELFPRYQKVTQLVLQQLDKGIPLLNLMGSSIDAAKLTSSITLFSLTAAYLAQQGQQENDYRGLAQLCDLILLKIKTQGYHRCRQTIRNLTPQIDQARKQKPSSTAYT
jgi:uncharacterized protein (DUF1810 family)